MTSESKQIKDPQAAQGAKKPLPSDWEQVSLKDYKQLRQKELEKRKKKKLPAPIKILFNIISFILAGIGIFILGFFLFMFITSILSQ